MLKIKLLREEAGMTQKEMALKLNTSNKNIWAYENGNAEPNIDMLKKIADLFTVSIDYLVERTDDFGNFKKSDVEIDKTTQRLLKILSTFNERQKERVLAYAEGVLESEKEYRRRIK